MNEDQPHGKQEEEKIKHPPVQHTATHDGPIEKVDASEIITAQDFLQAQRSLEQEALEALPYKFDTCTRAKGSTENNKPWLIV